MQLQNKNIVIIGGTTGMGLSAARSFIREGARIVVVGRNEQSVKEAGEILGESAIAFSGDATQTDTAVKAIQLCLDQFGGFDGLYHVAGSEIVDRYTFAVKVARIFDLDADQIQPIATADLGQQAPRPLKSGLLVDKAMNELGVRLSDVETGLRRLKEQFQTLSTAGYRSD